MLTLICQGHNGCFAGQARGGRGLNPCMLCPEALYCWPAQSDISTTLHGCCVVNRETCQHKSCFLADEDCCPCRHDECRSVIEERYGEKAAHWVQAMLHFSRKTQVGLQVSSAGTLQGPAALIVLQPPAGSSLLQQIR